MPAAKVAVCSPLAAAHVLLAAVQTLSASYTSADTQPPQCGTKGALHQGVADHVQQGIAKHETQQCMQEQPFYK
eukprot:CAMPEP_0172914930 /NCGR_PEP_ID=MMETSP1075-20121228/193295_1 /TAXON_ID=2916 /ORGANISM="Ceratium fusus, Strain PA161109" /LENGTH=73 /DNA_ID=CAMNT_0013773909 /DNA_START=261 /DNA_END=483 /DNA_ORIENTATION=+